MKQTSSARPNKKTEAARASRQAILEAAEPLFARYGFEATSLQMICEAAGVARGTPGYFFGSKADLYRTVLEQAFTPPRILIEQLRAGAAVPGARLEDSLRQIVEHVFDFFVAHPTFVRITGWESLGHGGQLGHLPSLLDVLQDALQVLRDDLGWSGDAEQFLIDLMALCYFPVAHADTFLVPLGLQPLDPAFLERRKRHVVEVMLQRA